MKSISTNPENLFNTWLIRWDIKLFICFLRVLQFVNFLSFGLLDRYFSKTGKLEKIAGKYLQSRSKKWIK